MASIVSVPNETSSSSSRYTRDGRRITYSLDVIQQPQRARACGSGAKSSADRRPVDPPPIVVLRIFEGEAMNEITFSYNANFFLFATLENARTIAQGRLPPSQASIPVLTGTPVAGMSYLDRPQPAGYFIFPDLSVRHEGKYRLSFTLYEQLKDGKDGDEDDHITIEIPQINAHVSHRLEVKSTPFTVYSAKRFPGLAESTTLSTTVAEQGCRVRIRKDVRMRRRDPKPSAKWQNYEDETAPDCTRRTATPDGYGQQHVHSLATCDSGRRSRSVSLISNGNGTPVNLQQRRSSPFEASQGYIPEYAAAPQTPQQPNYSHNALYSTGMQHNYYNQHAGQQPSLIYQQAQQQQQTPPITSPHYPHYPQQHPHHDYHQHNQYQQQHQQEYQQMMQPPQALYPSSTRQCHPSIHAPYQQIHSIQHNPQGTQIFRSQPKDLDYCLQPSVHDEQIHHPQNGSRISMSHLEQARTGHVSNVSDSYMRQHVTPTTNPMVTHGPLMSLRDGTTTAGCHPAQTDVFQPHSTKPQLTYTSVCFSPSLPAPSCRPEHPNEMIKLSEGVSTPQQRSLTVKRGRSRCRCGTGRLVDGRRPDTLSENENCSCQSSDEDIGHSDGTSMLYRRADGSVINRRVLGSG